MKKPSPNPLVAKALTIRPGYRKGWLELLPPSKQAEIIEAARQWPSTGQPWTCLAKVVKEQFALEVSVRMVCDALKKASQS